MIYANDKHIPEQPKTVSISPEKMGDFIKCLEVLAQVMKITIVSARNLFETNEIK